MALLGPPGARQQSQARSWATDRSQADHGQARAGAPSGHSQAAPHRRPPTRSGGGRRRRQGKTSGRPSLPQWRRAGTQQKGEGRPPAPAEHGEKLERQDGLEPSFRDLQSRASSTSASGALEWETGFEPASRAWKARALAAGRLPRFEKRIGRRSGIRTRDLPDPNRVLCQAKRRAVIGAGSPAAAFDTQKRAAATGSTPAWIGAPGGNRTRSQRIKSPLLGQLSFEGRVVGATGFEPAMTALKGRRLASLATLPRVVPAPGVEPGTSCMSSRRPCRWSMRACWCPRRISKPRPPGCKPGALPLSYRDGNFGQPGAIRTRALRHPKTALYPAKLRAECGNWGPGSASNQRPPAYKAGALPTELPGQQNWWPRADFNRRPIP